MRSGVWVGYGDENVELRIGDLEPSDNLARGGVLVSNFAPQKFAPVPRPARSRVSGSEDSRREPTKMQLIKMKICEANQPLLPHYYFLLITFKKS